MTKENKRYTSEQEAFDFLMNHGVKVELDYESPYSVENPLKIIHHGVYSLKKLAMIDCLVNYYGYRWRK
jgi:hypothetical protein